MCMPSSLTLTERAILMRLSFADEDGDRYLMQEMGVSCLAAGHCWDASLIVLRAQPVNSIACLVSVESQNPEQDWCHVAVQIMKEGVAEVHDYTARQFNPTLPFPLILPLAEWVACIELNAKFGFLNLTM